MNFEQLLDAVSTDKPFALSRWGDGEWLNIRGVDGRNCDGNIYYKDLGDRLKQIVSEKQDYFMGCQQHDHLISDAQIYDQDWFDSDFLHQASINQTLHNLIKILDEKRVVYVGNIRHSGLKFIDEFVEIPLNNVWKIYDETLEQIKGRVANDRKIFVFSAGMCANVFIHDLWKRDNQNIYIDAGSVFDPYVGLCTRGYMSVLDKSYIRDL